MLAWNFGITRRGLKFQENKINVYKQKTIRTSSVERDMSCFTILVDSFCQMAQRPAKDTSMKIVSFCKGIFDIGSS